MYDVRGVWVGLSKLNMLLGYSSNDGISLAICYLPRLSCDAWGMWMGPCPLFNLLSVGDLLLNNYLRNSFG